MPVYFVAKAEKEGVCVQLEVNGIPQVIWPNERHVSRSDQFNRWIYAGQNELRVRLEWPEDEPFAPGTCSCELSMEALQAGQRLGSTRPIVEFKWPPKNPDDEQYPYEVSLPFTPDDPPPSDFWVNAKPINFTDRSREEVVDALTELHKALTNHDMATASRLLDFKMVDSHKSHYWPATEARTDLREFLEMLFEHELEPLEPDDLEMHVLSDNRIVWVTGPDYGVVIRTKGGEQSIEMPVYYAPIDGKWTVVR